MKKKLLATIIALALVAMLVVGCKGAEGLQGLRGPAGPQGAAGIQGDVGPQGEAGLKGASGASGSEGEPGPQGEIGPEGPTGPQGKTGAGAKGSTGATGATGSKGDKGDKGEPGQDISPETVEKLQDQIDALDERLDALEPYPVPDGVVWVLNPAGILYDSFMGDNAITNAIAAADADWTIKVGAGTYTGDLVIDEGLTLQGAGKDAAKVTGTITIMASDTTVEGFRVEGTVYVNDSLSAITDTTISNNFITGDSYGVRVGYASECAISLLTIKDNDIIGNANKGICFWKVDWEAGNLHDVTIQGNNVSHNGNTGISTYGAGPYFIIDNTVSGNAGNGISIKYDDGDVITGNTVEGNTAMGINMHQVTNCTVENNTVSGQLSEVVVTTFWGGEILAGKGSGIYIHEASENNTISDNNITGNHNGILVSSESGELPSGNSINQNNITDNTYYGVVNALVDPLTPVDATLNWWGLATETPAVILAMTDGDVAFDPWSNIEF